MNLDAHWQTICRIVELLAERRYEDVIQLCAGSPVSAEGLEEAVAMYGRTLDKLPEDAQSLVSSVRIKTVSEPTWSVVVPLFTHEEGRSDLSLELTLTESNNGFVSAKVDGLHVL